MMKPSSDHRPYRPVDCILVSCLFLFIADSIYLIHSYSGARIWLEDTSEFFFFVQFQYSTTLIEGIIFGVCLLLLFFISKRFLSPQSANAVVNIGLIALAIVLVRKVLLFNSLIPIIPIIAFAKWAVITGLGIFFLTFLNKKTKKIITNIISKNIIAERGMFLTYLAGFILLCFSGAFFLHTSNGMSTRQDATLDSQIIREASPQKSLPSVLLITFDNMSATHTNFENYPRNTTPNLEKFSQEASYYKNHFSSGTYTNPGAFTIMSGKHVPHHRIFTHKSHIPAKQVKENIFTFTNKLGYKNIFYTDTSGLEKLAWEMSEWIHLIKPGWELKDYVYSFWETKVYSLFDKNFHKQSWQWPSSTFLDPITLRLSKRKARYQEGLVAPSPYAPEIAYEWVYKQIKILQSPSLFYLHLNSPRPPFHYRKIFKNKFSSDPVLFSAHPVKHSPEIERKKLEHQRSHWTELEKSFRNPLAYDRMIFDNDEKFGKFISELKRLGFYDDAMIIVTSDHGTTFQGSLENVNGKKSLKSAHGLHLPYYEQIKVPLVIKFPRQQKGEIYSTFTSSVDLSPSLMSFLGQDIPGWIDGEILPGFPNYSKQPVPRSIFSMSALTEISWNKLRAPVTSLLKYPHHLIYYSYTGDFELYNFKKDKGETKDISEQFPEISGKMAKEVLEFIEKHDSQYAKRD